MTVRLRRFLAISLFYQAVLLSGCGGGDDHNPGVIVSAIITPVYNGKDTSSVDAFRDVCTNSSGAMQPEFFADHTANASIFARLINSNDFSQLTVHIDGYTIDYISSADSPGAPSIQPDTRADTIVFEVSSQIQVLAATDTVELADLVRKNKYMEDLVTSPIQPNNYTVTYTFRGHSGNGEAFTFTSRTNIQIADFNYCPSGFLPS